MKRKTKPKLSYPGLRYAHKKLNFACKKIFFRKIFFLRTKFDLRLKKVFQNDLKKVLCRHEKMPVIQIPYMEIVWKAFFFFKKK